MNSLTPFIHHALPDRPGPSSAPEANCSRCSPPLGKQPDPTQPPGDPSAPGTQLAPAGSARQSSAPGTGQRSAGRCAHDRRHPRRLPPEKRAGISGREGSRCDGAICPGAVQHPAAHSLGPPRPGGGRRRGAAACGVARKRPLRLSRTKNFPLIFALPVEILPRFPYYGSKQR